MQLHRSADCRARSRADIDASRGAVYSHGLYERERIQLSVRRASAGSTGEGARALLARGFTLANCGNSVLDAVAEKGATGSAGRCEDEAEGSGSVRELHGAVEDMGGGEVRDLGRRCQNNTEEAVPTVLGTTSGESKDGKREDQTHEPRQTHESG